MSAVTRFLIIHVFIYQDEDTEALLAADFEIGHFIRERIVPRAVLYFTGEALENDDDVNDLINLSYNYTPVKDGMYYVITHGRRRPEHNFVILKQKDMCIVIMCSAVT